MFKTEENYEEKMTLAPQCVESPPTIYGIELCDISYLYTHTTPLRNSKSGTIFKVSTSVQDCGGWCRLALSADMVICRFTLVLSDQVGGVVRAHTVADMYP